MYLYIRYTMYNTLSSFIQRQNGNFKTVYSIEKILITIYYITMNLYYFYIGTLLRLYLNIFIIIITHKTYMMNNNDI